MFSEDSQMCIDDDNAITQVQVDRNKAAPRTSTTAAKSRAKPWFKYDYPKECEFIELANLPNNFWEDLTNGKRETLMMFKDDFNF